jgi:hypothetical protein
MAATTGFSSRSMEVIRRVSSWLCARKSVGFQSREVAAGGERVAAAGQDHAPHLRVMSRFQEELQ